MKKPIVWVAVAYRTAAGGFLNSAEIEAEGSTNNGLFDQRLALEWIQENVAQFSGDPSKVVLIGESAGAFAIGRHLLAFDGAETSLFRGAILQSGGPTSENFLTSEQSKLMYTKIVEKAGCANETSALACLRALPFDAWNASIAVTGTFRWNPVRDGGLVGMGSPTAQLKEGRFVQVPLLIGGALYHGPLMTLALGHHCLTCTVILQPTSTREPPSAPRASTPPISSRRLSTPSTLACRTRAWMLCSRSTPTSLVRAAPTTLVTGFCPSADRRR